LPFIHFDHSVHGALGEPATTHAAHERGVIRAGIAAQGEQRATDDVRQEHLAGLLTLALGARGSDEYCHLGRLFRDLTRAACLTD
jgi:hypothetical protein